MNKTRNKSLKINNIFCDSNNIIDISTYSYFQKIILSYSEFQT